MMLSEAELLRSSGKVKAIEEVRERREISNEILRRLIIENKRVDLLATLLCGYYAYDPHLAMMEWNELHPDFNLILAFRDLGKTTISTINDAAWEIVNDPNVRLLLGSKTDTNARAFLRELKRKLVRPDLVEVFGQQFNAAKWNEFEIEVIGKTMDNKEPTVRALGAESAVASQHYDVIYGDDIVSEDNSRTENQRDTLKRFFYSILDPCLEPPFYRPGRQTGFRVRGTRYHPYDLYHHIMENDQRFEGKVRIIPATDINGVSNFPEKFSDEYFREKRAALGSLFYFPQYMLDTEVMKGEVFDYNWFRWVDSVPAISQLSVFTGVDLAISQKKGSDSFAIVTVGVDNQQNIYLLHYWTGIIPTGKQTKVICRVADRFHPVRTGIEATQYQEAKAQELRMNPDTKYVNAIPVWVNKNKVTRAMNVTPILEDGRFHFYTGMDTGRLEEQLVMFPKKPRDLVDALVIALNLATNKNRRGGKRRKREKEPGLI